MQQIVDRMYTPLLFGFEVVSSIEFVRFHYEQDGYVDGLEIGVDKLVATIPESLHERMRADALSGLQSFQRLVESTVRLTAKDYVNTPSDVRRPKKMSFNATDMDSLSTNVEYFLDRNCWIWDDNEFQEYKTTIADPASPTFIEDPDARDKIATYVKHFVSYAMARIPQVLNESECYFDSETDDSDFDEYWASKMTGEHC